MTRDIVAVSALMFPLLAKYCSKSDASMDRWNPFATLCVLPKLTCSKIGSCSNPTGMSSSFIWSQKKVKERWGRRKMLCSRKLTSMECQAMKCAVKQTHILIYNPTRISPPQCTAEGGKSVRLIRQENTKLLHQYKHDTKPTWRKINLCTGPSIILKM